MSLSDPLGDMLTRTPNGQHARHAAVISPSSSLRKRVLQVLQDEGFIRGFEEQAVRDGIRELRIELKYHEGTPVIRELERISKPGRRVYSSIKDLPRFRNGLGVSILSTPSGVMTDAAARQAQVGGEVLCRIF